MDVISRNYELILIAVPELDEQGVPTLTERVTGWITSAQGNVTKTSVWGRQRLAYAIRKQTEGIYILFNTELAPSATRDLERNLRIDQQVIRHLLVHLDKA